MSINLLIVAIDVDYSAALRQIRASVAERGLGGAVSGPETGRYHQRRQRGTDYGAVGPDTGLRRWWESTQASRGRSAGG
ncbi:hypothetical protein ABGB17_29970 [Sphaerisporangium sp. B11E5]|uniref:hypothetical protein n=1 Tax=Sphaerisporangium sp. B11E5 TaxID=3153563 RepID=UPI00325E0059